MDVLVKASLRSSFKKRLKYIVTHTVWVTETEF